MENGNVNAGQPEGDHEAAGESMSPQPPTGPRSPPEKHLRQAAAMRQAMHTGSLKAKQVAKEKSAIRNWTEVSISRFPDSVIKEPTEDESQPDIDPPEVAPVSGTFFESIKAKTEMDELQELTRASSSISGAPAPTPKPWEPGARQSITKFDPEFINSILESDPQDDAWLLYRYTRAARAGSLVASSLPLPSAEPSLMEVKLMTELLETYLHLINPDWRDDQSDPRGLVPGQILESEFRSVVIVCKNEGKPQLAHFWAQRSEEGRYTDKVRDKIDQIEPRSDEKHLGLPYLVELVRLRNSQGIKEDVAKNAFKLSHQLWLGHRGMEQDRVRAVAVMRLAAGLGDAEAQYALGGIHSDGGKTWAAAILKLTSYLSDGLPGEDKALNMEVPDFTQQASRPARMASLHRRIAAKEGQRHAQRLISARTTTHIQRKAARLRKNEDTEKEIPQHTRPHRAHQWYVQAAEHERNAKQRGKSQAMLMLGIAEWEGKLKGADIVQAEPWFLRCQELGDTVADEFLRKINAHVVGIRRVPRTTRHSEEHRKPRMAPADADIAMKRNTAFFAHHRHHEHEELGQFLSEHPILKTMRTEQWRGMSVHRKEKAEGKDEVLRVLLQHDTSSGWTYFEEVDDRPYRGTPIQEKAIKEARGRAMRARSAHAKSIEGLEQARLQLEAQKTAQGIHSAPAETSAELEETPAVWPHKDEWHNAEHRLVSATADMQNAGLEADSALLQVMPEGLLKGSSKMMCHKRKLVYKASVALQLLLKAHLLLENEMRALWKRKQELLELPQSSIVQKTAKEDKLYILSQEEAQSRAKQKANREKIDAAREAITEAEEEVERSAIELQPEQSSSLKISTEISFVRTHIDGRIETVTWELEYGRGGAKAGAHPNEGNHAKLHRRGSLARTSSSHSPVEDQATQEPPTPKLVKINIDRQELLEESRLEGTLERCIFWTNYSKDQCTWEMFTEPVPLEAKELLSQPILLRYAPAALPNGLATQLAANLIRADAEGIFTVQGYIERQHFSKEHANKFFVAFDKRFTCMPNGAGPAFRGDWVALDLLQTGSFEEMDAWQVRSELHSWQLQGYEEWQGQHDGTCTMGRPDCNICVKF